MGTIICCGESKVYNTQNVHIYQINRYNLDYKTTIASESRDEAEVLVTETDHSSRINTEDKINEDSRKNNNNNIKKSNTSVYSKKQTLKNKDGEFQLLSYDIEEERFMKFKVIFPIIKSIEGLNELSIDSKFYLCGISPKKKNEGSFLFEVDMHEKNENNELNAQMLINSQFPHVYPSLIYDSLGQIICVGGRGQTHCELYNNNLNKWYILPSLPEERYKCTLCIDAKNIYVYSFGGINTKDKNNNKDNSNSENENIILRMHLVKQLEWENIVINNESKNLIINRYSAGSFVFRNDEDFMFIVGGEKNKNQCLDDVIRFSIEKCKFEPTGLKLKNKAKFINQIGFLNNEQNYYFIDSFNQIHLIERHDCLPMDYHPEMI
jgi:hypothetical protein